MIRRMRAGELDRVVAIWFKTNTKAHDFIPESYWENHVSGVREAISEAEVYVYENEEKEIDGFIGLTGNYIAGLFVREEMQSGGIGRQLLVAAQKRKDNLQLHVYRKNRRAVSFYQRAGFRIGAEQIDENTGEEEYQMVWETSEFRIMRAAPEDAEAIIAHTKQVGSESDNLTYGPEGISVTVEEEFQALKAAAESRQSAFFLAKRGEEVAGVVLYRSVPNARLAHRGEIGLSVVKKEWGFGIGSLLLETILDFAKNTARAEIVSLEVRSDNTRAIHLYKKYGFRKIGCFPGYMKIRGELVDCDLMVKKLEG